MRILITTFILVLMTLLAGCTGSTVRQVQGEGEGEIIYDGTFDPLSLEDDDIIINGEDIPDLRDLLGVKNDTIEDNTVTRILEGFRVQIFTTRDLVIADSVLTLADSLFHGEAYLSFDAPNYKIRVGNCQSRTSAVELQTQAITLGFRKAWILRTMVFENPPKREEQPVPEPESEEKQEQ